MTDHLAAGHDHPAFDRDCTSYRFGNVRSRRGRSAFNRTTAYMKSLIAAVADAKVRRMQRELALRGIYFDASEQSWVTGASRRGRP